MCFLSKPIREKSDTRIEARITHHKCPHDFHYRSFQAVLPDQKRKRSRQDFFPMRSIKLLAPKIFHATISFMLAAPGRRMIMAGLLRHLPEVAESSMIFSFSRRQLTGNEAGITARRDVDAQPLERATAVASYRHPHSSPQAFLSKRLSRTHGFISPAPLSHDGGRLGFCG